MDLLSSADKFLRSLSLPGGADPDLKALVMAMPFEALRQKLLDAEVSLPRKYAAAYKRLKELDEPQPAGATYLLTVNREKVKVILEEYKACLQDTAEPYSREGFYKRRLIEDINHSLVLIDTNAEVIRSNKGMDDNWIKQTVSLIRSEDRQLRKDLKSVFKLLVADSNESN